MSCEVTMSEAMDKMFTSQGCHEEGNIIFANGIKASLSSSVHRDRFTYLVKIVINPRGVINNCQSVQVGFVCAQAYLPVAVKVGDALGHGIPVHELFAATLALAANAKLVGMIDNCLDSQYASEFVVHFYPVFFHPVFHARSGPTLFEGVKELTLEVPVKFSSEEGHDILGAEAYGRMSQQILIQGFKTRAVLENHVCGKFSLVGDPIVTHVTKGRAQQGVNLSGEGGKDLRKVFVNKTVCESLCPRYILNLDEGVLDPHIVYAMLVQFPGQPFVAVDVDLDDKGEPGLNTHVHESELTVYEVEVKAQTAGIIGGKPWFTFPIFEFETLTGLDDGKHAYQTFADAVPLSNLSGSLFFPNGPAQVKVRTIGFPGYLHGVGFYGLGAGGNEFLIVCS